MIPQLSHFDYLLCYMSYHNAWLFKILGDIESKILSSQLDEINIERPIFITGLARSGTTILLMILSEERSLGSHKYKDFPFVFTPYMWNRFQSWFSQSQEPVERAHKDRILITKDSAEGFEEPIWQFFFDHVHDWNSIHVLTESNVNPDFEHFFKAHMKKILLLRNKARYISKNNYNVVRIRYLHSILPHAKFLIPIRHPYTHVYSLNRQHQLFKEYSDKDKRIPEYMRFAGHYEFGPQRVPINISLEEGKKIHETWDKGNDLLGYAIQWASVYKYVWNLAQDKELNKNVKIVRYEDLCLESDSILRKILKFLELEQFDSDVDLSIPTYYNLNLSKDAKEEIWQETKEVAKLFGYTEDGNFESYQKVSKISCLI